MKAKEILDLYEDNQLTADECYELVSSYFIKRMKSINADIEKNLGRITATFYFPCIKRVEMKQVRKYARSVNKLIGPHNYLQIEDDFVSIWVGSTDYSNELDIKFLDVWVRKSFLKSKILEVMVKFNSHEWKSVMDNWKRQPEIMTEVSIRQNIFSLIDAIVKAIRLTPVE